MGAEELVEVEDFAIPGGHLTLDDLHEVLCRSSPRKPDSLHPIVVDRKAGHGASLTFINGDDTAADGTVLRCRASEGLWTESLPRNRSQAMRLPRFSISSILALIAIVAVALAALRSPSYLWANVTFSLALGAFVVGLVNVIYGRNAGRAYWVGFSLCGGVYLAISSVPGLRDSVCPRLATEVVLDFLYPHLSPPTTPAPGWTTVSPYLSPPVTPASGWTTVSPYSSTTVTLPAFTFVQQLQPPTKPPSVAWTEPDRTIGVGYQIGTVSLGSSEAFRQIGHSIFTLLMAVLGGTFARYRYRASRGNEAGLESGH